jgi:CHAD domain-containing protein
VRRLLPLARAEFSTSRYAVLDEEEKTVVRIAFDNARVRDPQDVRSSIDLAGVLRVEPVQGYGKAYARLLAYLEGRRGLSPSDQDLAARALAALGREPCKRRSGLEGALDPAAPVGAAFLELHRGLVAAMRVNEPGIRADLDSEHLHDFRVAVRRSRVLHRIFREEMAGTEFEALILGFKWLGRVTGPTRDLDVHLLELSEQQAAIPEEVEALLPLDALLRERRQEAWETLVEELDSSNYAEVEVLAAALLDLPESEASARMAVRGPPLGPWALQRVAKAHRRLVKRGRCIDRRSPDEQLHELRIDAKKLRYLLEFFRSLVPAGELGALVKELKRLQDNLGDFNDACVQSELLRGLARDLEERGRASADALLAIGRLVERAEARKAVERADFEARFTRFEARETHAHFRRLFGSGREGKKESPTRRASAGAGADAVGEADEESAENDDDAAALAESSQGGEQQ